MENLGLTMKHDGKPRENLGKFGINHKNQKMMGKNRV